jgi:hypothetical protein
MKKKVSKLENIQLNFYLDLKPSLRSSLRESICPWLLPDIASAIGVVLDSSLHSRYWPTLCSNIMSNIEKKMRQP